jgi:hypothetical protein
MKILADVNVSPRVVAALRADGFDAVRVQTYEVDGAFFEEFKA